MSSDESQLTSIPESFLAAQPRGWKGRPLSSPAELRARYELCEDLSHHLLASAQALHHDDGLHEQMILRRCHAGLASPESGFSEAEALWVVHRLSELAGWEIPDLR